MKNRTCARHFFAFFLILSMISVASAHPKNDEIRAAIIQGKNVMVLFYDPAKSEGDGDFLADWLAYLDDRTGGPRTVAVEISLKEAKAVFPGMHIPKNTDSELFVSAGKPVLYHPEPMTEAAYFYVKAYFHNRTKQVDEKTLGFELLDIHFK